jgi:hypothetical protein
MPVGSNGVDNYNFTNNTRLGSFSGDGSMNVWNCNDAQTNGMPVQDPMMLMDPATISQTTRDGNSSSSVMVP